MGGGRGEEEGGSVNQGEKKHQNGCRALARCWCIEKNQTPEDYSAPFTFWDHPGCSNLGETEVTMATHADSDKLVHLCRLGKKKTFSQRLKKHFVGTHLKHHFMCSKVVLKESRKSQESMRGSRGGRWGSSRKSQTIHPQDI